MIILGFGITEERVRSEIINALSAGIKDGKTKQEILSKWNNAADEYDKQSMEVAPERYTRVYHYDNTLHFHHINRRHALSPDGWALWKVEEPFTIL